MNTKRALVLSTSVLFLALVGESCTGDRDRPDPTGTSLENLDLTVELLSPTSDQSPFVAGRDLAVRVRAAEPGRRLKGLGYEVRRSPSESVFHTDQISFPPTTNEEHTFSFTLPEDLPDNTLLNIRAFSVGQGEIREVTDPTPITVVQCNGAPWCS